MTCLKSYRGVPIEQVETKILVEARNHSRHRFEACLLRGSALTDEWMRLTLALDNIITEREMKAHAKTQGEKQ